MEDAKDRRMASVKMLKNRLHGGSEMNTTQHDQGGRRASISSITSTGSSTRRKYQATHGRRMAGTEDAMALAAARAVQNPLPPDRRKRQGKKKHQSRRSHHRRGSTASTASVHSSPAASHRRSGRRHSTSSLDDGVKPPTSSRRLRSKIRRSSTASIPRQQRRASVASATTPDPAVGRSSDVPTRRGTRTKVPVRAPDAAPAATRQSTGAGKRRDSLASIGSVASRNSTTVRKIPKGQVADQTGRRGSLASVRSTHSSHSTHSVGSIASGQGRIKPTGKTPQRRRSITETHASAAAVAAERQRRKSLAEIGAGDAAENNKPSKPVYGRSTTLLPSSNDAAAESATPAAAATGKTPTLEGRRRRGPRRTQLAQRRVGETPADVIARTHRQRHERARRARARRDARQSSRRQPTSVEGQLREH